MTTLESMVDDMNEIRNPQLIPVPVDALIRQYEVLVEFGALDTRRDRCYPGAVARSKAIVEAEFVLSDRPKIRLYRRDFNAPLSCRERFSLAHELCHFLIWKKSGELPVPSNYWKHERVCNAFASKLLVPEWVVNELIGDRGCNDKLFWPGVIARKCTVSLAAASNAITDCFGSNLVYLRFMSLDRPQREPSRTSVQPTKLVVTSSSTSLALGKALGIGFVLPPGSLSYLLDGLADGKHGEVSVDYNIGSLRTAGARCAALRQRNSWLVCIESTAPLF